MGVQIDFPYPFSGFNSLTFTNCYAGVYMHLEGIVGIDDYECPQREGKPCSGCGHCSDSTAKKQEAYYDDSILTLQSLWALSGATDSMR